MAGVDDRENSSWYIYRRAFGIIWGLIAIFFLLSILVLFYVSTENLCQGETTCEKFSKSSYKQIHQAQLDAIEYEMSMEHQSMKRRFSIMAINDDTNP